MQKAVITGLWRNAATYSIEVLISATNETVTLEVGGMEYGAAKRGQVVQVYESGGKNKILFNAQDVDAQHWS